MSDDENASAKAVVTAIPTSVSLSPTAAIDMSYLPESVRAELLAEHTRGMLGITRKAQELQVDVVGLQVTLGTLTDATRKVAQDGNAATLTHSHTSAAGRTEIIMGNTAHAKAGRLSKSQTGERDWTPIYIIVGIIALVLIATAFAK